MGGAEKKSELLKAYNKFDMYISDVLRSYYFIFLKNNLALKYSCFKNTYGTEEQM